MTEYTVKPLRKYYHFLFYTLINGSTIQRDGYSALSWLSSNLQWEVCCLERGKVKHQRVLWLTLLTSALLSINFVLKLDVCLQFEHVAGRIFQIANIVLSFIK